MEDEQGDAANESNNIALENDADDAYDEGIMVEIVGSDVFVNGVSGEKEDSLVSGQVENWDNIEKIEGTIFSDSMYENQNEIGFLGSKGECDFVDMEGLNVDYVAISGETVKNEAVDKYTDEIGNVEKEGEVLVDCGRNDGVFYADAETVSIDDDFCGVEVIIVEEKNLDADGEDLIREFDNASKFDDVADLENGESYINISDLSCVGSDEYFKNGEAMETEISEDNVDIPEENRPNTEHIDPEPSMRSLKSPRNAHIPSVNVSTEKINISEKETCVRDATVSCVEVNKANEGYTEVDITEPELETGRSISETNDFKPSDEETMKWSRMNPSRYLRDEGDFAPSDLVWGKVRSHPWWPGQIFDPSHASEKAIKHRKKGSYLVAYFGDGTFAWNKKNNLKPFGSYFGRADKQSKSETFQDAIDCALEEVSRRVELGLACSCVPKDELDKIEAQVVDNAGIREESRRRYGVDRSTRACYFEPDKLFEYVRDLASCAFSEPDRLGLVIARTQLSAFYRFKGYRRLAEFASYGDLLENAEDREKTSDKMVGSKKKQKNNPKFVLGRKRKASFDPRADGSDKRVNLDAAKVYQNPKPLLRIGDCIRRAASRLTGPTTSLVKGNNVDEMAIDDSCKHSVNKNVFVLEESFSVYEMLDRLEIVAQNPKKGDEIQDNIRTFLKDFRKKDEPKSEKFRFGSSDESYWGEEEIVESGRESNSSKRFSDPTTVMELDENVKESEQESSSPAELILNFADRKCVRSETDLNKTFRRFGPLMESDTQVDHDSGRAKVIFKRSCDAEVALNSSEKFDIFGPVAVGYEIGYSPSISVKSSAIAVPELPEEDETLNI